MRSPRTSFLLILLLVASIAVDGPLARAADAPTKAAPAPAVAPELARFNDLLAGLAESLKPALVHVRVRRAAVTKEREAQIRQKAEEERQKVWEKALEDQRILTEKATKTQEELARQEARERAEAERKAREAAERAAKALSLGF